MNNKRLFKDMQQLSEMCDSEFCECVEVLKNKHEEIRKQIEILKSRIDNEKEINNNNIKNTNS